MKLEDIASASWLAAAAAFGALALETLKWGARTLQAARAGVSAQRKTDVEFGRELRDELWKEIGRLRVEVEAMRDRADECDQRALDCQAENLRLAERVSQLEARQP